MNGDNINDIYVDGGDRIWLANYPAGVTIRNNRYQSYEWFRHSPGNSRSLVNDQVHDVIEDSEGDLWFATSNGISLLQPAVGRWRSFLSRSDGIQDGGNHIFLTLCEVSPGGEGVLYEDDGDNNDYSTVFATTILRQSFKNNKGEYVITPRQGIYTNGVNARSYTFRIYNTTQPVAVKVNGVETSNYSYDVKRKCTNIDIPCTDCTTEVKVRVVYSK